jgi:hypothetical protein
LAWGFTTIFPRVAPAATSASGALLLQGGSERLGINAIAARAQADKVLIGGLGALLAVYAEERSFWWSIDELIGPDLPSRSEATPTPLDG